MMTNEDIFSVNDKYVIVLFSCQVPYIDCFILESVDSWIVPLDVLKFLILIHYVDAC